MGVAPTFIMARLAYRGNASPRVRQEARDKEITGTGGDAIVSPKSVSCAREISTPRQRKIRAQRAIKFSTRKTRERRRLAASPRMLSFCVSPECRQSRNAISNETTSCSNWLDCGVGFLHLYSTRQKALGKRTEKQERKSSRLNVSVVHSASSGYVHSGGMSASESPARFGQNLL